MSDINVDHIRDDGTIDDTFIETYFRPCESIRLVPCDSGPYLRVFIDDGPTNIETRIPYAWLERAGFIAPKN